MQCFVPALKGIKGFLIVGGHHLNLFPNTPGLLQKRFFRGCRGTDRGCQDANPAALSDCFMYHIFVNGNKGNIHKGTYLPHRLRHGGTGYDHNIRPVVHG